MNLINPKPRFGYNPDAEQIYDYVAQKDVAVSASYPAPDATWNLAEVKRLILAGLPIEAARIGPGVAPAAKPKPTPPAPIANLRFPASAKKPTPPSVPAAGAAVAHAHGTGMSVEQLKGLKLSALQAAALGLTTTQLTATGVTAAQVANWGMNAARADALKLTPEQRAVLLP
jgi:hypothetical protein